MSTPLSPSTNTNQSLWKRVQSFLQRMVVPHPSISDDGKRRRAQLLSALSLLVAVLTLLGGIASPDFTQFIILAALSFLSYALSRSKLFNLGAYIFSYSLAGYGFLRIYQGTAATVESAISSNVFIALVLASALLSQRSFFIFVMVTSAATFAVPLYSNVTPNFYDNVPRIGGVVFSAGILLFGMDVYLSNLERDRLLELKNSNLELEAVRKTLETQVAERTADLQVANTEIENRASRFLRISDISLDIAANVNLNLQDLMNYITSDISEKTGYYHVGLFLLDEQRTFAVLRAANSPGGKRMLDRRHQLRVGGAGIVGYVSQSGRPRVALDTGTDAVFFNNPDLPETRSEMALPMKIGPLVIGALDVQSTKGSAFNDEDVSAFTTLANQIAIIIQNSLIRQGGDILASPLDAPRAFRRYTSGTGEPGFSYMPDGTITSAIIGQNDVVDRAINSGEMAVLDLPSSGHLPAIAMPVKLREQLIGMIHVEATNPARKWTEDEINILQSVSERAALALENASLFEAAEFRASQEQVIAQVANRIGASNEMNRILQTTIQELGRTLGATRTFIQFGTSARFGAADTHPEEHTEGDSI